MVASAAPGSAAPVSVEPAVGSAVAAPARAAGSGPAVVWVPRSGISPVGIPGMVGGGNGKIPPMTSAANALRTAAGAGAGGAGMPGGSRGSTGAAG